MERISVADVDQAALSGRTDRRALDEALGTTDVAVKYYELAPGDAFSGGYHTHHDQEELFYVLSGTATFDTEAGEAAVAVDAGEAIRFAPGEFQHGYNAADDGPVVRALALGAPPGMDETVTVFTCPACGEETRHDVDLDEAAGVSVTECRACGDVVRTDLDG
ncbi:MAG: cupin domain-containing protein [Haloarculaceae archaeon]